MQPDEDAILRAKLQDAIRLARQGSGAHFIGFLNERQAALAAQETEKMQFKNYLFGAASVVPNVYVLGHFQNGWSFLRMRFQLRQLQQLFALTII